jgi:hypothetical protein
MARLTAHTLIWLSLTLPLGTRGRMATLRPEFSAAQHAQAAGARPPSSVSRQPPRLRGDFVPHRGAGRDLGTETFWR